MSIGELISIVDPPANPIHSGNEGEWIELQNKLGIQLPTDYKEFGECYGDGLLCGDIVVYNPFSPSVHRVVSEAIDSLREIPVCERVYNVHPDRPGLLPWGYAESGYDMMWFTQGNPDEWPTILHFTRSADFQRYDFSMTTFLSKTFLNQIRSLYTEAVREQERMFDSREKRWHT